MHGNLEPEETCWEDEENLNPFWGEPTPTDVWDDMKKLDSLYEELL